MEEKNMNTVQLFGYATEPKVFFGKDGRAVSTFSLCVPDYSKKRNSDGSYDIDYINVVLFGNQANLCHAGYITKGTPLMISGKLSSSTYTVEKDGVEEKRYSMEVIAAEVNFVPRQKSANEGDKKGGKK